jgi:hypothetical protein
MQFSLEKTGETSCALYRITRGAGVAVVPGVEEFIVSTPESQKICNDPLVYGVDYTRKLRSAGMKALRGLRSAEVIALDERSTAVLTILRGGLNFELRESLAEAFGWNAHDSWFISAQRTLTDAKAGTWRIEEDAYSKIYAHGAVDVVFGDVVATGTSLRHGLSKLTEVAKRSRGVSFPSVTFFTIGGGVTAEILCTWRDEMAAITGAAPKCAAVYFEGLFGVASPSTPLSIKIDGTDLLRRDGVMAPEFIASQYESPLYPLERCTIYDAGSRAFHVAEYLEDVVDYWQKVASLAEKGATFTSLCEQRCPEIDPDRFGEQNLSSLAERHLTRLSVR